MLSDGTPLGGEKNIGSIARWPECISSFVCERVHKLAHTHARTLREINSVVARSLPFWSTIRPAPVACSVGLRQFGQQTEDLAVGPWSHDPGRFDLSFLSWNTHDQRSLDTDTTHDSSCSRDLRFARCRVVLAVFPCVSCCAFPLHTHCTFSANFFIMNIALSSSTSSSSPLLRSELCCSLKHFA